MSLESKQTSHIGNDQQDLTVEERFEFTLTQLNQPNCPVLERFSRLLKEDRTKAPFVASQLFGIAVRDQEPLLADYARNLIEAHTADKAMNEELGSLALAHAREQELQTV